MARMNRTQRSRSRRGGSNATATDSPPATTTTTTSLITDDHDTCVDSATQDTALAKDIKVEEVCDGAEGVKHVVDQTNSVSSDASTTRDYAQLHTQVTVNTLTPAPQAEDSLPVVPVAAEIVAQVSSENCSSSLSSIHSNAPQPVPNSATSDESLQRTSGSLNVHANMKEIGHDSAEHPKTPPKPPCLPNKETLRQLSRFRSTEDFIRFWGYPCESHYVSTQDGHILAIHRIPCGRKQYSELIKEIHDTKKNYDGCHGIVGTDVDVNTEFKVDFEKLGEEGRLGRPMVLWHGLSLCDSIFVSCPGGPKHNLAFYLADAGYDVWLANSRGNRFSKKLHDQITSIMEASMKQLPGNSQNTGFSRIFRPSFYFQTGVDTLMKVTSLLGISKQTPSNTTSSSSPASSEDPSGDIPPNIGTPYVSSDSYWDFTLDDLARYDVPAVINYVLMQRKKKKLLYCGFSQSTTIMFAALTIYPELSSKIECFVGLSPALSPAMEGPLVRLINMFGPTFAHRLFGNSEFLPFVKYLVQYCPNSFYGSATHFILKQVCGWHCDRWPVEWRDNLYCNMYGGTSVLNMTHWFHIISRKNFENLLLGSPGVDARRMNPSFGTEDGLIINYDTYDSPTSEAITPGGVLGVSLINNEDTSLLPAISESLQRRAASLSRRKLINSNVSMENIPSDDDYEKKYFVPDTSSKASMLSSIFIPFKKAVDVTTGVVGSSVRTITSILSRSVPAEKKIQPQTNQQSDDDRRLSNEPLIVDMQSLNSLTDNTPYHDGEQSSTEGETESAVSTMIVPLKDPDAPTGISDPNQQTLSNALHDLSTGTFTPNRQGVGITRSNSEVLAVWDDILNDGVSYPVHNIRIPIYLFCGTDDALCNIPFLRDHLYSKTTKIFTIEGREHMDLLWAVDAPEYWDRVISIFQNFKETE